VLGLWTRREGGQPLTKAHSEFSDVVRRTPKLTKSNQTTEKPFVLPSTMSNIEVAEFTTGNAKPIVCQRCLQFFKKGTELYFMQDKKPDVAGKRVCAGCRQYYLSKTETRQREHTLSSYQSMHLASLP
jgi:hypothetical protein